MKNVTGDRVLFLCFATRVRCVRSLKDMSNIETLMDSPYLFLFSGSTIAGEPRVNLLATLVSLGNCLQETGVAGGLLDIITGGIAQKDKQCG